MSSLVFLFLAASLTAEPRVDWQQTDHSLALVRGERTVWQFHYKPEEGKPYFHPVSIAGSDALTDLRPADHPWHRAMWFSWKFINGVLYWEEDPKTGKAPGETQLVSVKAEPRADHSARFDLSLAYHPVGQPTVLSERRVIEVSPPAANGAYAIDWHSVFTAGASDVTLDRTPIEGEPQGVSWGGYAGFSLRLAPALQSWQFVGSEGTVAEGKRWDQARWMAFAGPLGDGKSAAIAVLDHPASFRHPTPWYLIREMPYFSPAVLYRGPHTLPAGQTLTLRYRVLLQPGPLDAQATETAWRRFAEAPAGL